MLSDLHELVYGAHTAKDSPVAHFYVAGQLGIVAEYTVAAYLAIVCEVAIGHNEAVVAYSCFPAIFGTAVDGYKFADRGIISNLNKCFFSFKLKVLRNGGNNCSGKYPAVLTDAGAFHDGYVTADPCAFTDLYILVYNCEWIYFNVGGQSGVRMDIRVRMDHCIYVLEWSLELAFWSDGHLFPLGIRLMFAWLILMDRLMFDIK